MSWICFWFLVKNVVPHSSFGWVLRMSTFPHFCSKSNVHIVRVFFRISNSTPLFLGDVKLSPHEWCSFGCTKTVGRFQVRAEAHSSLPLDPWRHISAIHGVVIVTVFTRTECFLFQTQSLNHLRLIYGWYIHTYLALYYIIYYYIIYVIYCIYRYMVEVCDFCFAPNPIKCD